MIEPAFDLCPKVTRSSPLRHVDVDYKCDFENMDRQMHKDIRYLSVMYGYIVPIGDTLTFNDFADLIAEHYDQSVPRNAFVTNQLRSHQENVLKSHPCVVFHPQNGVFMGEFLGLGFWSQLDPAGQDAAITFQNKEAAESMLKSWPLLPEGIQIVPVKPDADGFASIEACVAAGLPAWHPEGDLEKSYQRDRQTA